jgi:hypothetical protein
MAEQTNRFGIGAAQVAASALAAVSSAVAASTLGVAGTVIGAAIGSVVATTATSIYLHSLQRTRDRLRVSLETTARRGRRPGVANGIESVDTGTAGTGSVGTGSVGTGTVGTGTVGTGTAETTETAQLAPVSRPVRPPADRRLRWQPVAATAAAVFLIAVAAISGYEIASGRSVAGQVGGGSGRTTIGEFFGGQPGGSTPGGTPSSEPTPSAPAQPTDPTGTPTTAPTPGTTSPGVPPTGSPEPTPSSTSPGAAPTSPA